MMETKTRLEFIEEIAKSEIHNGTYHRTFINVFGHFKDAGDKWKITKGMEGHLTEIYKYFEKKCPALTTAKKGKKEILRDYLQKLYSNQRDFTGISDRLSPPSNPQNIPTPDRIQELTTLEFIGRDRDLTNLANLRNQYKIVLIKAGAGVGKSTLAREFLQKQFKKVIRIEMGLESGNVTPAEEKVSQILRKDFDEEPSRDFGINLGILGEKLADRANPIGVLIDNLEPALDENYRFREKLRGYDALLSVLGDRDVCSFTLITSRRSLIATRAKVHEYSLEGLDITAWQQYFHDCENGANSEALMQMRDAYNGNAKVMDILHGAIKNRFDGNIGAYWSRYKGALLANSELETLISVEMDWLRDNQPDAYKLLCRMGCYRYQDIKTVPFEGLICLLWDVPESRRVCVVDYLSKSSLIEAKGEYHVHPAIREAIVSRMVDNLEDKRIANCMAAEFWTKKIKIAENIDDAMIAFESYHHYIEVDEFEKASDVLVKSRPSKWNIGRDEILTMSFSRLGLVQEMINALTHVIQRVEHISNYRLSLLFGELAYFYWVAGDPHKSIKFQKKCRNVVSNLLESDCLLAKNQVFKQRLVELKAGSLMEESFCNIDLGNLPDAIDLIVNAITLSNIPKVLKSRRIVDLIINIAYSNDPILGLKNRSYYFIIKNLVHKEIIKLNFSPQSTGHGLIFLALAYKNLGKTQESLNVYYEAINFSNKTKYSLLKAKSLNGIAEIYRKKNDFNQAISNHIEVIDLLNRIGARFDKAEAYFQLGLTYQAMGEHDQAEEYKAKAIELFAQMEAPKQIDRVNKAFEQGAKK